MKSNQKGFTLTELVIGMAIISLILAGVFQLLSVSVRSYQLSQNRTYEIQQARNAFNQIASDLASAQNITYPSIPAGITVQYDVLSSAGTPTTYQLSLSGANRQLTLVRTNITANPDISVNLIANIVNSFTVTTDPTDKRLTTITMGLNNPQTNPANAAADYTLQTIVCTMGIQ